MARFNSGRFDSIGSKFTVLVFLIFFCVIALLGSPLHAHDLESSHDDLDCVPCLLVDSKVSFEHEDPDLFVEIQEIQSVSISKTHLITLSILSVYSRGPPVTG